MKLFFCLILFIVATSQFADGQETNECHKSTEGTDFWFGFMENRWYSGNSYLEITVTAREATTFSIEIGPNKIFIDDYTIGDNESRQIRIPWDLNDLEATGSEIIQNRGIHLTAEKPVNVYALNYDRSSADIAVIYPVESLGTEYYAMCYTPHVRIHNDGYAEGKNSEFLIVATEDSTSVSITPSVVTDQNRPAGISFTITLNAGEVYQVQSANNLNLQGQGDLTGSRVTSDKPIAFYSGALATTVPYTEQMCCYDHLYEQIPPIHSWGKEYYIVPLKARQQDRYRILAAEENTSINIQGKGMTYLNPGVVYEFVLYNDEPLRILADKPILIAQFSQSRNVDQNYTNGNGDPFMIILSPASQSKNDVTFVAYTTDQISNNFYINIISLTSEINNIELDGTKRNSSFRPFLGSEYSYAQIDISTGVHHLKNINPDRGFLAYVYAFGNYESYGYGVGFNLDLILDIGQSINLLEGDTLQLCYGESITLDAGPYFDTYEWNTEESSQRITVNQGGEYWAHTTTNDGCNLYDSIYIKMNHPVIQNKLTD
ncbi:MAG: IgGFc-binding protein, partial [Mariniphaga sp.]|nr:IgGFc-binding protein [Mariniphaga sp.]